MLPWTIIGIIITAPLFRGLGSLAGFSPVAVWVLTPGCLDTLGAGALLAVVRHAPGQMPVWLRDKSRWLLWIGLALLIGMMALGRVDGEDPLFLALYDSAAAMVFVFLVAKAAKGISGPFGRALD